MRRHEDLQCMGLAATVVVFIFFISVFFSRVSPPVLNAAVKIRPITVDPDPTGIKTGGDCLCCRV
jgi:hypothetical protein